MPINKGQVLLIVVFALTFSLFSMFMLLAPIKDKILRIKDVENIYQALANSEKGLEAVLLDIFKNTNLSLNKEFNSYSTRYCAGMSYRDLEGLCINFVYQPLSPLWNLSNDKFRTDYFIFIVPLDEELVIQTRNFSDGIIQRIIRTLFLGSLQ